MKKIVVALFLLLSLTTGFILGSCAEPDVKTTVKLTIKAGAYTFLNEQPITVLTSQDNTNGPSVLDVVKAYMEDDDTTVDVRVSDTSLTHFGMYYETSYNQVDYYWSFTVNGNEPKSGKANSNYVKDGDVIVYTLVAMSFDEKGKIVVSEYDNETGVFENALAEGTDDER